MTNKDVTEPYLRRYRWVMLALVWLTYAAFGFIQRSISPLVTPIMKDLNISYGEIGIILGSWQLAYIVSAMFAGAIIDKWGMRKSLFAGIIVMALSAGLRYFSTGFLSLLPFVALFGFGGPMISVGAPKVVSVWFQGKERGTAIGIYTTASSMGGAIVLAVTNSLVLPLTGNSWRLAFVWYGSIMLAVAIIWWLLAKDAKSTTAAQSPSFIKSFVRFVKIANVRVILAIGFLTFATSLGFTSWLPKILENGGLPPSIAGIASSIPLFAGIPSVLVFPRIIPTHFRARFMAILALLVTTSLVISITTRGTPLLIGLILFGISNFCLLPFAMLALMETPEVGQTYMGLAGGIFFCVAEAGGFLGPSVIGALVDWTHSFSAGGIFLVVCAVLIFATTFFLKSAPSVVPEVSTTGIRRTR